MNLWVALICALSCFRSCFLSTVQSLYFDRKIFREHKSLQDSAKKLSRNLPKTWFLSATKGRVDQYLLKLFVSLDFCLNFSFNIYLSNNQTLFYQFTCQLSIIYPPQTLKPVLALFSSKWWNILTTSPASCASTAPRGQSCTCRWHRETSFAGSSSSLPVLGKTSPSNVSVRPFLAWSVVASVSTMTQT